MVASPLKGEDDRGMPGRGRIGVGMGSLPFKGRAGVGMGSLPFKGRVREGMGALPRARGQLERWPLDPVCMMGIDARRGRAGYRPA